MASHHANATLSYTQSEVFKAFPLWVNEVSQSLSLKGNKSVSRLQTQFYPRSYSPGNYKISGICESQNSYHELALFIRLHQRAIAEAPVTDRFARVRSGNVAGYQRLLRLAIPTEGIYVRGWVEKFGVVNKGLFDPAPKYDFDFFVVHDLYTKDIGISHLLKKYQEGSDETYYDQGGQPPESDDGSGPPKPEDIHDPPPPIERRPPIHDPPTPSDRITN